MPVSTCPSLRSYHQISDYAQFWLSRRENVYYTSELTKSNKHASFPGGSDKYEACIHHWRSTYLQHWLSCRLTPSSYNCWRRYLSLACCYWPQMTMAINRLTWDRLRVALWNKLPPLWVSTTQSMLYIVYVNFTFLFKLGPKVGMCAYCT